MFENRIFSLDPICHYSPRVEWTENKKPATRYILIAIILLLRSEVNLVTQYDTLLLSDNSGGGATVAHHCRHDEEVAIRRQILIYSSLDYTMRSASIELNDKRYLLQREKIEWFFNNYFEKGVDREQASPLYMELDGRIPESLVIAAEFCPLRDEALTYVRSCKLVDSGLKTSILKI